MHIFGGGRSESLVENTVKSNKFILFDIEAVRFRAQSREPGSFANAISMGKKPGSGTGYPKSNSLIKSFWHSVKFLAFCSVVRFAVTSIPKKVYIFRLCVKTETG